MTELARHNQATSEPSSALTNTLKPGKLRITGDVPETIYVAPFVVAGVNVGGFGQASSGDFFQDGIKWKCGLEYSKFVTFVLLPGVVGLDCHKLPYSPVVSGCQLTQLCAMAPVDEKTKYRFFVKFPDGSRHDPQIIVTPITHTNDPE